MTLKIRRCDKTYGFLEQVGFKHLSASESADGIRKKSGVSVVEQPY